jgi:hypothetical protein
MADMIPAAKVAAAALRQVKQAADSFPNSYHDTDKAERGKVHLQVAAELLALIAGPDLMVNVKEDGTVKLIETPLTPPNPSGK